MKKHRKQTTQRKRVEDELKIALAVARFEGGHQHSLKELSDRFGRAPAVVSRAITAAFQEKLVEVRPARSQVKRVVNLEIGLVREFDLHLAVVVDTTSMDADAVHEEIGRGAGDLIANGTMIRDGDVVALGGGRGLYFSTRAVPEGALRARDVRLVSLCGNANPKFTESESGILRNIRPDADFVVRQFATRFASPAKSVVVSFPVGGIENAFKQIIMKTAFRERPATGEEERNPLLCWRAPSHALVGVGLVDCRHSLWRMVEEKEGYVPTELESLIVELRQRSYEGQTAVAEAAHILFRVNEDRPDGHLDKLIAKANDRLIGVGLEQLRQSRSVCLIAGTVEKVPAIRTLIKTVLSPKVRFLCTDRAAAEALLASKSQTASASN